LALRGRRKWLLTVQCVPVVSRERVRASI